MNRREALTATAALMGSAIIGSEAFLSGCKRSDKIDGFNEDVLALLDEIGETILPATSSSPGAGSCKIGEFMKVIVSDCYSPADEKIFLEGISIIQQTAEKKYGSPFVKITDHQKFDLMLFFDQEARKVSKEKGEEGQAHFFTMLNQLTVWGFFSSQPGATLALRYVPIPGRYDGCIPYKTGEGAWVY